MFECTNFGHSRFVNNPKYMPFVQTVQPRKVVTLSYVLRERDRQGEVLEVMDNNWPLIFLFGSGLMLPAFEAHLKGLQEGDHFEFQLPADDAYGQPREDNIVSVPIDLFKLDGVLQSHLTEPGSFITLTDDLGEQHNGKVAEVKDDSVRVDFNHAMAGHDLYFKGEILNIRDATEEEIKRNQYVESDGVHTGRDEPNPPEDQVEQS